MMLLGTQVGKELKDLKVAVDVLHRLANQGDVEERYLINVAKSALALVAKCEIYAEVFGLPPARNELSFNFMHDSDPSE